MSDDNLKDLLKKTRKKNEARHVTGMLLYLDPFFMQVLEGEETMVNELFNLIKQDSRHHKVSLIYKKPKEERYFSNWTMGFSKIGHEKLVIMEGFSDFLQKPTAEFFSNSPSKVDELLYKFKHEILF
jgi:hypothetical protein